MTIENYVLKNDVKLVCFEAESFPEGVQESFRMLSNAVPDSANRDLFGISYPGKDGKIQYKAAAVESFEGEAAKIGSGSFTVLSGKYISIYVADFMSDESRIGKAFRVLLTDPRIDPKGCCVEMYVNRKDVRCMVRLEPEKAGIEKEAT